MNRDLDLKSVQDFLKANSPAAATLRQAMESMLSELDSIQTIDENGNVEAQTLGKLYAHKVLLDFFERIGFTQSRSPSKKVSFR